MPTYQYECSACGHAFEALQSMTEPKLRKCPSCKKFKLQRLIGSGAGIIFKGAGFYQTDYKKPSVSSETRTETAKCEGTSSCACHGAKKPPAKKDD